MNLSHLETSLKTCMLADRHALRRKWRDVSDLIKSRDVKALPLSTDDKSAQKSQRLLSEIAQKISRSQAKYQARLTNLPKPEYPLELPVSSKKDEISAAISKNQVVIVCGETGSGKTTQLPKICLELGRGVSGLIGHTQPRRIAARSVASRIAQELNSPLGEAVGYKVRFNDKLSESSYIKLMTDGILLAETQGDKFLNTYDTIIIDEAHERSLNIDFLLGYLKQLLPKRPDLKIIVTSATIDANRFSQHFNGAPVIEVSGRTYPVEIRYRPLGAAGFRAREIAEAENAQFDADDDTIFDMARKAKTEARWLEEDDEEEAIEEAILDAADDLLRLGDGDILVFLPGEREIRDVADHLRKYQGRSTKLKHIEVLPLFARLSIEDQQKIFKSHSTRRIVLATNVAETSLTVPGIKYVIDAGLARMNRYSPRAKVEQLQIEKISQAAAKQRAGRCGRVSNGTCVRLYSEQDFYGRPEFTEPEILRSSLASVILRMAALRLGDVTEFPFIEAPSSRLIADGYQQLQELGAVDARRQITETGLQLAKLPLDPRVGRMILAARREHCLKEVLIITSVLSMQDPRERPMDKREAADNAHAKFAGEGSDFMGYLKLWDFFDNALKTKKSNKDLLNQCHTNFLSFLRLKEWRELHGQLLEIISDMEFKLNEKEANFEQIHKALLAGLLGNIGFKDGESESYAGARGIRFHVAPGSTLKKSRPKWVMAAELMDTTKLYARCVAKIEPDWIEPLARGLTESNYTDPRWDRKMGMVNAWERVSLYGLTIIPKRRVNYGPINPTESREIFIREALANGEFDTKAAFFTANERLIAEVEELEHKARRQDVLIDEHQLFAFYDAKIPADIFNAASFEHWRTEAEKTNAKLLYLTRDDLMRHGADAITAVQFPEKIVMDGVETNLKYRFEPGHILDGVTATIPLALLNQLNLVQTEWLVPGMLREKLTYLIKALPKAFRCVCVPVPEFVTGFLEAVGNQFSTPLLETLAAYIQQKTTLKISKEDWNLSEIPAHHLMNFSVVDDAGRELAMGRDWNLLKKQLGSAAQLTFRNTSPDFEKTGLKQWDFGDLPQTLSFERDGLKVTGYPALEDADDSISVKLFDTKREAELSHRKGVCRLMRFELKEQMKQLEKSLPNFNQYALVLRNIIPSDDLREDIIRAIADRAFIGEDDLPRTNADFMKLKQRARTRLPAVTEAIARQAQAIASEYQLLTQKQSQMAATVNRLKRDLDQQVSLLVYKGCFSQTPWEQLQHIPRYLKALRLRIEKQPANPDRDGKNAASVGLIWQKWQDKINALNSAHLDIPPGLQDFRWLIEELRVSLFAQELKTPFPISIKRLEKTWADMRL
ncbi:MAG: ATP-dependent RNA helicase HrpA [Methylotenera sp.]|nr:ATP-dependent RNA helicase HrpA [Methylotenera sp.]MDO9233627.1 ATP-dependent RNA helicase HrpA [Methylotenera sp.]MDP2403740.1 ATP-dependent RNA helicase HrpA [Methylotenera sp.]MDP3004627.1 ATP-dependent RNA helicase HrpA [Methylotenera sp.]MDZ4224014.1 ATP-dependent RNA helicase HrpA [Methylotenera sp.]